jgi:hypothetical protein
VTANGAMRVQRALPAAVASEGSTGSATSAGAARIAAAWFSGVGIFVTVARKWQPVPSPQSWRRGKRRSGSLRPRTGVSVAFDLPVRNAQFAPACRAGDAEVTSRDSC